MDNTSSSISESPAVRLGQMIETATTRFDNKGFQEFDVPPVMENLKQADLYFTASVLGMKAISHVIEDQAVSLGGDLNFYTGFQKFSRAAYQRDRYERILDSGSQVFLFGVPDTELWQHPNLQPVPLALPDSPDEPSLANNWFVVLHHPTLVSMALVSREISNPQRPVNAPDKLVYRRFEGFWTYDRAVIAQVVDILEDYLEQHQN